MTVGTAMYGQINTESLILSLSKDADEPNPISLSAPVGRRGSGRGGVGHERRRASASPPHPARKARHPLRPSGGEGNDMNLQTDKNPGDPE